MELYPWRVTGGKYQVLTQKSAFLSKKFYAWNFIVTSSAECLNDFEKEEKKFFKVNTFRTF